MSQLLPNPEFKSFQVRSIALRQAISRVFLAACILISTISIIVLAVLLSSIVVAALPAFGPHADAIESEHRIVLVDGKNPDNDPDKIDAGDLIQGVFQVNNIARGGLGAANDSVFVDKEDDQFTPEEIRLGFYSFQVSRAIDDTTFSIVPATGSQSVANLAKQIGVTTTELGSSPESAAILILKSDSVTDFDFSKLKLENTLVQDGKMASVITADQNWQPSLAIGPVLESDFLELKVSDSDLSAIKRVRNKKKAGEFAGVMSVVAHDLGAETTFKSVIGRPAFSEDLILGDVKIETGELAGVSRRGRQGFDLGGRFYLEYCPVPETDASAIGHFAHFLKETPKSNPAAAGIGPALMGSIWVILGCAIFALPLGVGTAVFLEEFKPTGKFLTACQNLIQLNMTNLAGVPSIVYGILGLTAFATMFGLFGSAKDPYFQIGARHYHQYLTEGIYPVLVPVDNSTQVPVLRHGMEAQTADGETVILHVIGAEQPLPEDQETLNRTLRQDATGGPISKKSWYYLQLPFGRSVLAMSLTLMLVILPVIIIASQEALRAVPSSLREGAMGLGSTPWQVVRNVTLPAAIPSIMTGAILSISRAIGEAAPVLMICGIVYIATTPQHLMATFSVLPIQIYYWAGLPVDNEALINYQNVAAAGIFVLLAVLLTFNAIAIAIRQFTQKPLS